MQKRRPRTGRSAIRSSRSERMLYGVFIMDDSDECLSEWLILFTGVGDEDLPPCLSRESLQLKKMDLYAGSAKKKDAYEQISL